MSRLNGQNGLSREGLEDRILYCARELEHLRSIKADCTTCWHFRQPLCSLFDEAVPDGFVATGCESWEYNDVPF